MALVMESIVDGQAFDQWPSYRTNVHLVRCMWVLLRLRQWLVHDIVMIFMDLHIFAKFFLDVLVIVNLNSSNQLSGVDVPVNTIFWWEDV
jgi:hypothetical protein